MPARESEAIVLRSFPLGEGDLLVSFFTRAHGRLRGVASGARKPKSRFGGTLEPLSYIHLWFYERETRDLVRVSQCEILESFLDAQREYTASLVLAVASEVTEAVLGEREVAEPNFRLLLLTARAVKAQSNPTLVLAYFALWSVRLGGWLPNLDRCGLCGTHLSTEAYASEGHGLLCGSCRISGQRAVLQTGLTLARRMLNEKLERLMKEPLGSEGLTEIKDYMLDVIEQHIERRLQARKLLQESLEPWH
jgi:DNA repair protein RecO (recombination protein O)